MTANFTLLLIGVFAGAIWWGWQWPYIAKLMPLYVAAIPGLVLAGFQLYRDATHWETGQGGDLGGIDMDEVHDVKLDSQTELWRTLIFFAWFIGGAAGIWLLGIVISLPLLAFLYVLVEGREKLRTALIMSGCAYGLIGGLFEYTLAMRWPSGLLFGY